MKMPTFPTIDMSAPINWFIDGIMAMFTANIGLISTAIIVIGLAFSIPKFIKRFSSKVA